MQSNFTLIGVRVQGTQVPLQQLYTASSALEAQKNEVGAKYAANRKAKNTRFRIPQVHGLQHLYLPLHVPQQTLVQDLPLGQ